MITVNVEICDRRTGGTIDKVKIEAELMETVIKILEAFGEKVVIERIEVYAVI